MAENKKSFLLYCDVIHTVEALEDQEAGQLFKHLLRYVNDQNPCAESRVVSIAFEPIKQQLKRDLVKYENIRERNKGNGQKGGRPARKPKKPSGLSGNPKNPDEPQKADNDTVNDNDIKIKEIVSFLNQRTGKNLNPTTKETVRHLTARLKTYTVEDAKKVIEIKTDEWMGTEWEKYLVPDTLFAESNFEKYLNQKPVKKTGGLQFI